MAHSSGMDADDYLSQVCDDFFNLSKPVKALTINTAPFYRQNDNVDMKPQTNRREIPNNKNYFHEYRKIENDNNKKRRLTSRQQIVDSSRSLPNPILFGYDFAHKCDINLPISAKKQDIIDTVRAFRTVIIDGCTGCGKSTQVPQYILDDHFIRKKYCNIIVTQPRRIAAISLAKRVCQERNWKLGTLVGYQIGMDKDYKNEHAGILYVTTGVFLRMLSSSKSIGEFTHVILDEVHERDKDMDFLMLLVKKILNDEPNNVKVIVMSASMNASMFADYFAFEANHACPIIQIPGLPHSIHEFWLDQFSQKMECNPKPSISEPEISEESYECCLRLLFSFDDREKQVEKSGRDRKSVLIFLPGIYEIMTLHSKLDAHSVSKKWHIIPLHSLITNEEQSQVFDPQQPYFRKIILSTNIAESSVTVPDISYIIDFCLTKNLVCDMETNFESLKLEWATWSNLTQRGGRAGRVDKGYVYRMVPHNFAVKYFQNHPTPEIQRSPLDKIVLTCKKLNMGEPRQILAQALDPPYLESIVQTVFTLKELGGLTLERDGIINYYDGSLTFMGLVMEALPIDIHLSRLILLGYCFGCLEDAIIIAAGLSVKSIFSRPFRKELLSYYSKLFWSSDSFSDCLAILNVYKHWKNCKQTGKFKQTAAERNEEFAEKEWCASNYIEVKHMRELDELVVDLKKRLGILQISDQTITDALPNHFEEQFIKFAMCGAFYPYYFLRQPPDERDVARSLSGQNPLNTVVLYGLPMNEGYVYEKQLRNLFSSITTEMELSFENTKAFVSFKQPYHGDLKRFSSIHTHVYLALKMKQLRTPFKIYPYKENELNEWKRSALRSRSTGALKTLKSPFLPSPATVTLKDVKLHYIQDVSHFWIHVSCANPEDDPLTLIHRIINQENKNNLRPIRDNIVPGMIVLAPYRTNNISFYYRARVKAVRGNQVDVSFVDYGRTTQVNKGSLRELNDERLWDIPIQVFESVSAEIRPNPFKCPNGMWSDEAMAYFHDLVQGNGKKLNARVYSIVHGVVHLELMIEMQKSLYSSEVNSVNDLLIGEGYAEVSQEDYLSVQDHESRKRLAKSLGEDHPPFYQEDKHADCSVPTINLPTMPTPVVLRGPQSPLVMTIDPLCSCMCSTVNIEKNSVNSILLDPEPQSKDNRLIVAANVSVHNDNHSITAKSTTMMPNIPGLPSLMVLLFGPYIEMRCDKNQFMYTGALSGLGSEVTQFGERRPLYPEHDVLIKFDRIIKNDDILLVNEIRLFMNLIFPTMTSEFELMPQSIPNIANLRRKIRHKLVELIWTRREDIPDDDKCYLSREWNQISEDLLLRLSMSDGDQTICEAQNIFRLLEGVELRAENNY